MNKFLTSFFLTCALALLVACGGEAEPAVTDTNPPANNPPANNNTSGSQPVVTTAPAGNTDNTAVSEEQQQDANSQPLPTTGDIELADPSQVVVTGSWYINEETGFLHAYGSVTNNTGYPISGMIAFSYFGADGSNLMVNDLDPEAMDEASFIAPIAPGETGYYERLRDLKKIDGTVTNVTSRLEYAVLEKVAPVIEFKDVKWAPSSEGGIDVSGSVTNSGPVTCNYPYVTVVFLKGSEVAGIEWGDFTTADVTVLNPNETLTFDFNQYFTPAEYDNVDVVLECSPTSFPR